MAGIAFLFPGQGAQEPGMGKSLYEISKAAREVFTRADELRPGTSKQCFSGTMEDLTRTVNTQPCMWVVEIATAAALKEAGYKANATAGFSLGEIAAIHYSGMMDFDDSFKLVCRRAELMDTVGNSETTMAAVLKLSDSAVEELCRQFEHVWPVNYNCPGQVTVSGSQEEIERFIPLVKENGGIAKKLNVSGAFHSPIMTQAAENFGKELGQYTFRLPQCRIYSDYTGEPYTGLPAELLTKQLCNPVRWQRIIKNMATEGIDTFVEVGPGKILTGFIKRIISGVNILSVSDVDTLRAAMEVLKYA